MHPTVRLGWAAAYTFEMCRRLLMEQTRGASSAQLADIAKEWSVGLPRRMGIEILSWGVERVDWSKPCVVLANHSSYLDTMALYRVVPRPMGFVGKKSLFAIPLFGGVARALGCVPIDRTDRSRAVESVREAAALVRKGSAIAVFPEGTRGPGDRILELKKGPFYLIEEARVPVVPIGIRGTARLMPRTNTSIRPGVIEVHVGDAIPPSDTPGREARAALRKRVREELSRLADMPMID